MAHSQVESERIETLAESLRSALGSAPRVAVLLGSGWSDGLAELTNAVAPCETTAFTDWPQPRVEGHASRLWPVVIDGVETLLCGGRVHAYEGHPARVLVRGVRALARWGVDRFLLLNAAGSLDPAHGPGSFLLIRDHLNLGLPNPLAALDAPDGVAQFQDLTDLYDAAWRARTLARLAGSGVPLREGVYAAFPGPSYETPAEVAAARTLGADAAGMSTVPEAIALHALGVRVQAISLLTNLAAGIQGSRPSHGEVLDQARASSGAARRVVEAAIAASDPSTPN